MKQLDIRSGIKKELTVKYDINDINKLSREKCVCLNIMSFGELPKKHVCSFCLSLSSSLNSVINNIYYSSTFKLYCLRAKI